MKVMLSLTAVLLFSTIPVLGQAGERGVSHPDATPITADDQVTDAATPVRKPSAAIPAMLQTGGKAYVEDDASAYHPYHRGDGAYQPKLAARAVEPGVVAADLADHDVDGDIVTGPPVRAGEVAEGTLLKVRMNDALSTRTTLRGAPFSATLTDDVLREGVVVIPAGSVLDGRVTEIRGGKRIAGRAAIHLEPRRVTLPDGNYYVLHAQVIDTGAEHAVRVNEEGTIVRRDHAKEMLAIAALTTGSSAVAGAIIGGGVGAVVGAGVGAGVSTVLWLKQDRQAALAKDTALIFSLTTPMMMQSLRDGAVLRP